MSDWEHIRSDNMRSAIDWKARGQRAADQENSGTEVPPVSDYRNKIARSNPACFAAEKEYDKHRREVLGFGAHSMPKPGAIDETPPPEHHSTPSTRKNDIGNFRS